MADNTVLNTGSGGDTIRDKDRAGVKTQIVALDLNPGGSETLMGGTMPATQSGTWTVQPGNTANTTAWKVDGSAVTQPVSGTVTANGASGTPVLKNALTNSASAVVSSTAATLLSYYCYNPNATVAYVQIYDIATAGGVTVGTTTPKWSIAIPATSAANLSNLNLAFANGIQVAATTAATNATAPGTALDCNFGYR